MDDESMFLALHRPTTGVATLVQFHDHIGLLLTGRTRTFFCGFYTNLWREGCIDRAHQATEAGVYSPSTEAGKEGIPRSQQASMRSRNAWHRPVSAVATTTQRSGSMRSMAQAGVQIALGGTGQARASTMCDQMPRHWTSRGCAWRTARKSRASQRIALPWPAQACSASTTARSPRGQSLKSASENTTGEHFSRASKTAA